MRRLSNQRREMDVEYEEQKISQSLTQVELDKENDYYMRPASSAHTRDPYAEDDYNDKDPFNTYHPRPSWSRPAARSRTCGRKAQMRRGLGGPVNEGRRRQGEGGGAGWAEDRQERRRGGGGATPAQDR